MWKYPNSQNMGLIHPMSEFDTCQKTQWRIFQRRRDISVKWCMWSLTMSGWVVSRSCCSYLAIVQGRRYITMSGVCGSWGCWCCSYVVIQGRRYITHRRTMSGSWGCLAIVQGGDTSPMEDRSGGGPSAGSPFVLRKSELSRRSTDLARV